MIPQSVPAPISDTTGGADSAGVGIRYESLVRFQDLLRNYGVEPGTFSAGAYHAPTSNLFVKVTAQLGANSRLAVSHNYGHGNVQDGSLGRATDSYPLSSSGTRTPKPSMPHGWPGPRPSRLGSPTSSLWPEWTTGETAFLLGLSDSVRAG